jgi:hypothetical protein
LAGGGGGGVLAQPGAGARGCVGMRPTWPASGNGAGDSAVGTGPRARGRGRLTALGGGDGGGRTGQARPPVRSAAVLRWGPGSVRWSGGKARAVVGPIW